MSATRIKTIDRTTLPSALLFAIARHYAAQDDMRPVLASVEFRPDPLELRAADGYQAVVASVTAETHEINSIVLIPLSAINTIRPCVKRGDDVELQYTRRSKQWALAYPPRGVTVAFTPVDATMPDIGRLLADSAPDANASYAYIDTTYLKNLGSLNTGEDCRSYVKVQIGGATKLVNATCRYLNSKATVRVGLMPIYVPADCVVEPEVETEVAA